MSEAKYEYLPGSADGYEWTVYNETMWIELAKSQLKLKRDWEHGIRNFLQSTRQLSKPKHRQNAFKLANRRKKDK